MLAEFLETFLLPPCLYLCLGGISLPTTIKMEVFQQEPAILSILISLNMENISF